MLPLRVAILWHQHQPYYKIDNEFILPWVRMHAVKDYLDLPLALHEFPNVKQTFNLAPSLMLQIDEYLGQRGQAKTQDSIQRLTAIPAKNLTREEKQDIIDKFFVCNEQGMIRPYKRYSELLDRRNMHGFGVESYSVQDWLDLQVWYNLTWIGRYSRQDKFIERLIKKGQSFSEREKELLMEKHDEIMSRIVHEMKTLKDIGQIEISCSPMFHPILPLLCDSESAKEAMPELTDIPPFVYPEDADEQIALGIDYYSKLFGSAPQGMWPSEGSVSDEALGLIAKNSISWIATDESVLAASMGETHKDYYKFFPQQFETPNGKINVFFRDHALSDKIGFVYSNWNPIDSATDFKNSLLGIRKYLVDTLGEECLEYAVVPIILDGENCWEFYHDNGIHFLRSFYSMLADSDNFSCITFEEALKPVSSQYSLKHKHIRAGSWINSNFSIWMGHEHDQKAWLMLSEARALAEPLLKDSNFANAARVKNILQIAEGSDWFWWYGPEHNAPNKPDFDVMFRKHIQTIYELIGAPIPENVFCPIADDFEKMKSPATMIHPVCDGSKDSSSDWKNAGIINTAAEMSTMHISGEIIKKVRWGNDDDNLYLRIDLHKKISTEKITIEIFAPQLISIEISQNNFNFVDADSAIKHCSYSNADCIDLIVEFRRLLAAQDSLDIHFSSTYKSKDFNYPMNGNYTIKIIKGS